jgi:hypothetical protein
MQEMPIYSWTENLRQATSDCREIGRERDDVISQRKPLVAKSV